MWLDRQESSPNSKTKFISNKWKLYTTWLLLTLICITLKITYLVFTIRVLYYDKSKDVTYSIRCHSNDIFQKSIGIGIAIYVLRKSYYPMIFYIKKTTSIFNKFLILVQINISGLILFTCLYQLDSNELEIMAIYTVLKMIFINELDHIFGIVFATYFETYYP